MITRNPSLFFFYFGALLLISACSGNSTPTDGVDTSTPVQVTENLADTDATPVAGENTDQNESSNPPLESTNNPESPVEPPAVAPEEQPVDQTQGSSNEGGDSNIPDSSTPITETNENNDDTVGENTSGNDNTKAEETSGVDDTADHNGTDSGDHTESTTDNTEPETAPPEVYEMTPVELLIEEVRLSAGAAILQISNKLTAGLTLSRDEQACLGDFDPATGGYLTTILCDPAVALDNSIMQVRTAEFKITNTCEAAISEGHLAECVLDKASILIPIEWIPLPGGERIANIQPIPGVDITYNMENSGNLVLKNTSTITESFECIIDIFNAQTETETSFGNCRNQIEQTINRLYNLRLSATAPG